MKIFYFTATGNSLAVARSLGAELISIPQAIKNSEYTYSDSVIGIVCPVFCFNLPKIVRRFIANLKINAQYVFLIGTYGNLYASFGKTVKKFFKKNKVQLDYVNVIKMVDNYLGGFEIADQIQKIPSKNYELSYQTITKDISLFKKYIPKTEHKTTKVRFYVWTHKKSLFSDTLGQIKLSVNNNCTKCQTCLKVCPVKNITFNPNWQVGNNCELCLSCVHVCMTNAIHFLGEQSAQRYRHELVSLKEIINSNNQK
jgi:ferredoxin